VQIVKAGDQGSLAGSFGWLYVDLSKDKGTVIAFRASDFVIHYPHLLPFLNIQAAQNLVAKGPRAISSYSR
jgi:hypothetical protein